jgi:hypothetical protein
MKLSAATLFHGRLGRSLSGGSLAEAFLGDCVAALVCCTALGSVVIGESDQSLVPMATWPLGFDL